MRLLRNASKGQSRWSVTPFKRAKEETEVLENDMKQWAKEKCKCDRGYLFTDAEFKEQVKQVSTDRLLMSNSY